MSRFRTQKLEAYAAIGSSPAVGAVLSKNASIAFAGTSYPMVEWGLNLNMTRKSYSLLRRAATVRMSSNATVPKLAIRNR